MTRFSPRSRHHFWNGTFLEWWCRCYSQLDAPSLHKVAKRPSPREICWTTPFSRQCFWWTFSRLSAHTNLQHCTMKWRRTSMRTATWWVCTASTISTMMGRDTFRWENWWMPSKSRARRFCGVPVCFSSELNFFWIFFFYKKILK